MLIYIVTHIHAAFRCFLLFYCSTNLILCVFIFFSSISFGFWGAIGAVQKSLLVFRALEISAVVPMSVLEMVYGEMKIKKKFYFFFSYFDVI